MWKCIGVSYTSYTWKKLVSEDNGENLTLDTTLTQSGKAADAKVVGNKITYLNGEVDRLSKIVAALQAGMTVVYGDMVISASEIEVDDGATATFTVHLDKAPTIDQTVNIAVSNSYISVNPTALTFTADNYSVPQTVTVTAVENSNEGDSTSIITLTSAEKRVEISVGIADDDSAIEWHVVTEDEIVTGQIAGVKRTMDINTKYEYIEWPAGLTQLYIGDAAPKDHIKGFRFGAGCNVLSINPAWMPNVEIITGGAVAFANGQNTFPTGSDVTVFSNLREFTYYPVGVTKIERMFHNNPAKSLTRIFEVPETVDNWGFFLTNAPKIKRVVVHGRTINPYTGTPPFYNNIKTIVAHDDSTCATEIRARGCTSNNGNTNASIQTPSPLFFDSLDGTTIKSVYAFGDSLTEGINDLTPWTSILLDSLTSECYVYNFGKTRQTSDVIKTYVEAAHDCMDTENGVAVP